MSRIGLLPITIPAGVDFNVDGNTVTVKGPNGVLSMEKHPNISIDVNGNVVTLSRPNDNNKNKALHGLTRSLVNNMVIGVTDGFKKVLEISGVGYRAQFKDNQLIMNLGYSHQVVMEPPEGIKVEVPSNTQIIISGADKQKVGQFAANVRNQRPPEPYKGKGIKYSDEHIRRKEGKAGKK